MAPRSESYGLPPRHGVATAGLALRAGRLATRMANSTFSADADYCGGVGGPGRFGSLLA